MGYYSTESCHPPLMEHTILARTADSDVIIRLVFLSVCYQVFIEKSSSDPDRLVTTLAPKSGPPRTAGQPGQLRYIHLDSLHIVN